MGGLVNKSTNILDPLDILGFCFEATSQVYLDPSLRVKRYGYAELKLKTSIARTHAEFAADTCRDWILTESGWRPSLLESCPGQKVTGGMLEQSPATWLWRSPP